MTNGDNKIEILDYSTTKKNLKSQKKIKLKFLTNYWMKTTIKEVHIEWPRPKLWMEINQKTLL
jgi:hypothetical protein